MKSSVSKLSVYQSLFALLLVFCTSLAAHASHEPGTCARAMDGTFQQINENLVQNSRFETERGFDRYFAEAFGTALLTQLVAVGPNGHVLHGGAGDFLLENDLFNGNVIANPLTKLPWFTSVTHSTWKSATEINAISPKVRPLTGWFSELSDATLTSEHGPFDLVIELWGIAAYTNFFEVIERYLNLLKPDGKILMLIRSGERMDFGQHSKVILPDGRVVNLTDFLLQLPDLKVTLHRHNEFRQIQFVIIEQRPGVKPKLPRANLVGGYEKVDIQNFGGPKADAYYMQLKMNLGESKPNVPKTIRSYGGPPPQILRIISPGLP